MKKILFVCEGDNFPNGAMGFIKQMHENAPVVAKGLFFEPIDFQQLTPVSYIAIAEPYVKLMEEEKKLAQKSIGKFIGICESNNIKYHAGVNQEVDKDLLIKETRFADLLVMSEELFCSDYMDYQPNVFMKEILRSAECPVIAIPEVFKSPDRIVVAYDGNKEGMFALKQFCYLLPQFSELPAEFVYINAEESDEIPDNDLLKEYVKAHFNSPGVLKLHFDAKKYFATWAEAKKNIMLVTGSFGRSAMSDLLHDSFAKHIIHDHKIPVFIAHHN